MSTSTLLTGCCLVHSPRVFSTSSSNGVSTSSNPIFSLRSRPRYVKRSKSPLPGWISGSSTHVGQLSVSTACLIWDELRCLRQLRRAGSRASTEESPASIETGQQESVTMAPLIFSFNENVRSMIDVIDEVRALGLEEEKLEFPTVVLVGDVYSGKTSVLESLCGITLPTGDGIVTRVPLILKLQSCKKGGDRFARSDNTASVKGIWRTLPDEASIGEDILDVTNTLAGKSTGVVGSPITLHVEKPGFPDLTLVDLPGIRSEYYDDFESMISNCSTSEYIVLNVLAADADFAACQSTDLCREIDTDGDRTLAVVTKVDRAPGDFLKHLHGDVVQCGLGYVCVRNKTDADASHAAAHLAETALFNSDPELSKIEVNARGISALAQRLTEIYAEKAAARCSRIRRNIMKTLLIKEAEFQKIPPFARSDGEAMAIISSKIQQQRDIMSELISGNYSQFPDEDLMHYAGELHYKLTQFEDPISDAVSYILGADYAQRCKEASEDGAGTSLPNMMTQAAVKQLVQEMVESIEGSCLALVDDCFSYATKVHQGVITRACGFHPGLDSVAQRQSLVALGRAKEATTQFVRNVLMNERRGFFTLSQNFIDFSVKNRTRAIINNRNDDTAGDLQIIMFSYGKVVRTRLCDVISMEVKRSLEDALLDGTDTAIWEVVHAGNASKIAALKVADQQRKVLLDESIKRLKACEATLLDLEFNAKLLS